MKGITLCNTVAPRHSGPYSANPVRDEFLPSYSRNLLWSVKHCAYCGRLGMDFEGPDGTTWNMDHVIPLWSGGDDNAKNIVKACQRCNVMKGPHLWEPIIGTRTASGEIFINWQHYAEKRRGKKVRGGEVQILKDEDLRLMFHSRPRERQIDPEIIRWHDLSEMHFLQ